MSHEKGQPHDLDDALEMARKRQINQEIFNELHPDLMFKTEDDTIAEWARLKEADVEKDTI